MEEGEAEVEEARRDGGAVDQQVGLVKVPAARPDDEGGLSLGAGVEQLPASAIEASVEAGDELERRRRQHLFGVARWIRGDRHATDRIVPGHQPPASLISR